MGIHGGFFRGILYGDCLVMNTPMMENQMEKKLNNEKETGIPNGLIGN